MSDPYPSNSQFQPNQRPVREKQAAVVQNVQIRKKPWFSRAGDRGNDIIKDIVLDVIGPYFRDMFADSGYRAVDLLFYRESNGPRRSSAPRASGRGNSQQVSASGYVVTDYHSQYQGGGATPGQITFDPRNKPFDFSVFVFQDYAAGREVIDRLRHIIHGYHQATVNDLYDLLGRSGSGDHTGENYGWDSLELIDQADIRRVRGGGGYFLHIPDARPLRKN